MTQFLDMNDDCIYYVLRYLNHCDSETMDTMVSISQTCKRLHNTVNQFTSYFSKDTSYGCSITSEEDEKRVKRTLAQIGRNLVELRVTVGIEYPKSKSLERIFFKRLPKKCPNLRILDISSNISTNVTLNAVQILRRLERLSVRSYNSKEDVDRLLVVWLAREAKELKFLKLVGAVWDYQTVINVIHEAKKLDYLSFDARSNGQILHYEINSVFMEEFRYLNVTNPLELTFFLEFRDLVMG